MNKLSIVLFVASMVLLVSSSANAGVIWNDDMSSLDFWGEASDADPEEGDSVGGIRVVDGDHVQMNSWWPTGGPTANWTDMWTNTGLIVQDETVYTLTVRMISYANGEPVPFNLQNVTDGWTTIVADSPGVSTSNFTDYTISFSTVGSLNDAAVGDELGIGISPGWWNNLAVTHVSISTDTSNPPVPSTWAYVKCRPGNGGDLASASPADLTITVDVTQQAQTIGGFGASDCWSGQYVGQWPSAKRNAIADLLFETNIDNDNNPIGIGLSIWRMNLGGGSVRQDNIYDHWRQSDFFYNSILSGYDWNRCPGQRNFLQMAKARGVNHFLAFSNSPPINMTKNGYAFCDPGVGDTNLASDKRDEFAVYLADVLEHFSDQEGIDFKAISPFNEPEWDWDENPSHPGYSWQEGCRYSNYEMKEFVNVLYPELQDRGLDTDIEICESGEISYLYTNGSFEGEHIYQFFSASSSNFIGLKLPASISSHSYWSDTTASGLISKRQALRSELDLYGLDYAQTEYCILGSYGTGRDLGIDPALYIARTIHFDMTLAEATSWEWWLGVSPYDYKDGLVYCDKNDSDGNYYESKMMWAMGNFSRFIRPGMVRLEVQRSDLAPPEDTVEDLMVSSYHHEPNSVVATVFVNRSYQSKLVQVDYLNLPTGKIINYIIPYVTSSSGDLTAYNKLSVDDTIEIPSRSVVTIVSMHVTPGDLEPDGDVDIDDVKIMAGQWLQAGNLISDIAPEPLDGVVNQLDLAELSKNWLAGR